MDRLSAIILKVTSFLIMYIQSVRGIALDYFDLLEPESVEIFRNTPHDDIVMYHSTVGRYIRNHYGLWNADHPLTKNWHANINRDIRSGIDYSKDHPDHISSLVMEAVWKLCQ